MCNCWKLYIFVWLVVGVSSHIAVSCGYIVIVLICKPIISYQECGLKVVVWRQATIATLRNVNYCVWSMEYVYSLGGTVMQLADRRNGV